MSNELNWGDSSAHFGKEQKCAFKISVSNPGYCLRCGKDLNHPIHKEKEQKQERYYCEESPDNENLFAVKDREAPKGQQVICTAWKNIQFVADALNRSTDAELIERLEREIEIQDAFDGKQPADLDLLIEIHKHLQGVE